MIWIIVLVLFLMLWFNSRKEGLKGEPDLKPEPHNAMPCEDWDKDMRAKAKNVDYYYCRGFNNTTCGSIDPDATKASMTPCPAGYAKKSALDIQSADEVDPMLKKNALGM
jgi:hypothetical protein